MKNYLFKQTFLLLLIATAGLTSCKKSETAEPTSTPQLSKVAFWNPSTGAETLSMEFIYDTKGTLSSLVYGGTTYAVAYNSSNKLLSLTGTLKQGTTVSYALEYNTAGQLVKIVYADGGINANTKTLTYNAAGKINKVAIVYTNTSITPYNAEYTWSGDNIATATSGSYTTTYTTYDDKLSPYSLADGIAVTFYGNPASKNNPTEIKTLNGSIVNTQKRSYEYNAAGYATSMKLLDGSNEGQKYYYK